MDRKLLHLQKATGYAGSEEFLVKLGRGLSQRGWTCRIGVIEEDDRPVGSFKSALDEAGWSVETIRMNAPVSLSAIRAVRGLIRDFDPGLVNTHLIHADFIGALASLGLDVPVITTKHNDDRFKHRPGYGLFARLMNRAFDHLVAISDHLLSFYRDRLGVTVPSTRIYYGLESEDFMGSSETDSTLDLSFQDETVVFGMVARLTEQKGHRELLEAFGRVLERHPENQLLLVGDGPLRGSLEDFVAEQSLEENVHFLGHRSDVPALLQTFDVFVHPSRWEGFGLVFLEAMAAGLPVVATRVSAIPEIVRDSETGYLVESGNAEELSEAMLDLSENKKRRDEFGRRGFERLKTTFGIKRMIDEYEELYGSLLKES